MKRLMQIITFIFTAATTATIATLLADENPIAHQGEFEKNAIQPWKTEHFASYSGIRKSRY